MKYVQIRLLTAGEKLSSVSTEQNCTDMWPAESSMLLLIGKQQAAVVCQNLVSCLLTYNLIGHQILQCPNKIISTETKMTGLKNKDIKYVLSRDQMYSKIV